MSVPIYTPTLTSKRAFNEALEGQRTQPLVLNENCQQRTDGDIFCLKDNGDGTAIIEGSSSGRLFNPFLVGYDTKMIMGQNNDRLYVRTTFNNKETFYSINIFDQFIDPNRNTLDDAWRNIRNMSIPYDYDVLSDDGCKGTDLIFNDDPVPMTAKYGALFIGRYILTPEAVLKRDGDSRYLLDENIKSEIEQLLLCALSTTDYPEASIEIESALHLLQSVEDTFYTNKGPYKFPYTNIRRTLGDVDIIIRSGALQPNSPVQYLSINIRPGGLFNDVSFRVNRLGMVHTYEPEFSPALVNRKLLDDKQKRTVLSALNVLLTSYLNEQDKGTIAQLIDIIQNPKMPSWAWHKPSFDM